MVQQNYRRVDELVNNAGISFIRPGRTPAQTRGAASWTRSSPTRLFGS
jgi:hypothetical protein